MLQPGLALYRGELVTSFFAWGELGSMVATGGILSAQLLAAQDDGEEESDYLETHTHLIEILKCIVDEKTWETVWL